MTTLSKEDVIRIAKDAGLSPVGRAGELMRNGDGRWVAVSALATIANLARADLVAENERLNNDLLDALDCKQGKGPTALATVIAERDELRTENERLRDEDDARYIHSCGPKCMRAGCVNRRLRTTLAAAEARETKLREVLIVDCHPVMVAHSGPTRYKEFEAAVNSTRDDSALREMIAGVYEQCAKELIRLDYFCAANVIYALAEKSKGE